MNHPSLPPFLRFPSFAAMPRKTSRTLTFALCCLSSSFAGSISVQAAQNSKEPSPSSGGFVGGLEVFDISKLDRLPEVKFRTAAHYPFEMRRAGVTGEVVVEFIVDTNGNVTNAHATKSSRPEFEANAVSSVSKWKFKPGQKGGRNVNTRMQVPIVFTLNED